MNVYDLYEEGRLIYRYGGELVGVFMYFLDVKFFVFSIVYVFFMDVIYDNLSLF